MAFSLEKFIHYRPHLYHLTSRSNLSLIRKNRTLLSARLLLERADQSEDIRRKRTEHLHVDVGGYRYQIRDQSPLHAGNALLADGWTFEDLVESLNHRVYFWAGNANKPSDYGIRHHTRYRNERPVIIRTKTRELLDSNDDNPPLFCKYNSGSPRCSNRKKSPRGPRTFVSAEQAEFRIGQVVEVTFLTSVRLPQSFEVSDDPTGPWT